MATVDVSLSDLIGLMGAKHPSKQIIDAAAMLGMSLEKEGDGRLVFEISPNRPDWLSVEGIARSIASFLGFKPGLREYSFGKPKIEVIVDKDFLPTGPYLGAVVARGVNIDEEYLKSMFQLQEKLCDTVGRRRKKVSMGSYDLSRLTPPIRYRAFSPKGLSFVPLESNENMTLEEILERHPQGKGYGHILKPHKLWPVIMDSTDRVMCLKPITNAEDNRLRAGTTADVFFEANGTSAKAVADCLAIVCAQMADRGAKLEQVRFTGAFEAVMPIMRRSEMATTPAAVEKLIGIKLSAREITASTERMGFAAKVSGETVTAAIPFYRNDIMHESDLIEDVAIGYGYDRIKGREPSFVTTGAKHPAEAFADRLRELIIGFGFQDCVTFTLTNEFTHYEKMLQAPAARVQIGNPLTNETTMVRTSILPSLLSVLSANTRQKYPQRLFEVGDVILIDGKDPNGCKTQKKLCAVVASKDAGISEIKSVLQAALGELGFSYKLSKKQEPFFIPTRSAAVEGEKVRGFYGEVHPQVLENFGIEMPVAAFEIWFE